MVIFVQNINANNEVQNMSYLWQSIQSGVRSAFMIDLLLCYVENMSCWFVNSFDFTGGGGGGGGGGGAVFPAQNQTN